MTLGTTQLREAFNAVASPKYTATQAFMSYVRDHDVEWTVIRFVGTDQSGAEFTAESPKLRPGTDVLVASADAARSLISHPVTT